MSQRALSLTRTVSELSQATLLHQLSRSKSTLWRAISADYMSLKRVLHAALVVGSIAPALAQQSPAPDRDGLKKYAVVNQQLASPQPGRPRAVLMGNSITEGWPRVDSAFFRGGSYELVGRGISGQTSPQMLVRFRQDVLDLHPQVVVILAGTNDVAENTGPYNAMATLNNIQSMTQLAQANGIRVVLASVLPAADFGWRKGLQPAPKIVALNQQIKALAGRQHCTYLDFHTALADANQGLPATYASDGVHPNLAGYRVMEPLLLQAVKAALQAKR